MYASGLEQSPLDYDIQNFQQIESKFKVKLRFD